MKKLLIIIIYYTFFLHYGYAQDSLRQKVLSHYNQRNDTIAYQAALFLFTNIKYHYSIESPITDMYYNQVEQINNRYKYPECIEQFYKLNKEPWISDSFSVIKDELNLDSDFLIKNIDMALADWREGTWARHLNFDEFCEYLLPYRIGGEQVTKNWREDLRKRYLWRAEGIKASDDQFYSAYWAATTINDALIKMGCHIQDVFLSTMPELPLRALKNMRVGKCYDYAKRATYIMRACGIPVAIDFTPQWPDRASNHHWNVLFNNSRKTIPFMGGESNPGYPCKFDQKLAKVYRMTYAFQPQSLFALNSQYNERIPEILNTPFIKDVSNEYFEGDSITVKLNDVHLFDKFAYISVFDNQKWIPIDFSTISDERTATFRKLGKDIVYLPIYWGHNGYVPAGNPILLSYNSGAIELRPNKHKLHTITLYRKYPLMKRIVNYRRSMKKGWFEASNQSDFSSSEKCAEIKGVPKIGFDTLSVTSHRPYRYWRYVAPKGKRCEIAELAFLQKGNHAVKISEYLSSKPSRIELAAENAFDSDRLSFYESDEEMGWIGIDCGKPTTIEKIAYIPRNDDNSVVPGEQYELFYYENGKRVSAGKQKAKNYSITFENVPSNALYILHNIDKDLSSG